MTFGPLDHLRFALQALAAPPQEQFALFPPFVCVPDELVLDFTCWLPFVRRDCQLSAEQEVALQRLDDCIHMWSGQQHADVWLDAAVGNHPVWFDFRTLAAEALAAFGWPPETPPSAENRGQIYVQDPFAE
jgi:hypothetical protein